MRLPIIKMNVVFVSTKKDSRAISHWADLERVEATAALAHFVIFQRVMIGSEVHRRRWSSLGARSRGPSIAAKHESYNSFATVYELEVQ